MDPKTLRRDLEEGHLMWNFSLESIDERCHHEDFFGLEHPSRASSWKLPQTQRLLRRSDVALITFDLCQFGLSVMEDGTLSQKTTKIATNNPWLAQRLLLAQCDHQHPHQPLLGGLPAYAQEYPAELCRAIAESAQAAALNFPMPNFAEYQPSLREAGDFVGFGDEDEEHELDPERLGDEPPTGSQSKERKEATESQKRLVQKLHVNLGHPPRERLLRALRAAGALPQILDYVRKEHVCDDCQLKQRPDNHRRAQLPRTYSFNKVVCVDYFYVKWQDQQVAILNMIDLGTSYQVAVRSPIAEGTHGGTPTSQAAWTLFLNTWIRFLGAPRLVLCDSGNEFKGAYERGLENMGIFQHVIHPESPWENGLAERHGGWLKQRLDRELASGRGVIQDLTDLDELLSALTSTKNNWLNKGGYTPSQLVFGQMTRVPGELLAEDDLALHGLQDAFEDPLEVDEAAGEYRRRFQIRQRARQLAMKQDAKDAVQHASRAATHQSRHWSPGQWVYVFRRGRANQELHLRDRWVGPGVVVLANNGTVYVGMRSRLWRCTSAQLRPALPSEILGKDLASDPGLATLLRKVLSGARAGAVDVAREGPPPSTAGTRPIEVAEDGVQIADAIPIAAEPQHAPEVAPLLPPGLLPPMRPPEPGNVDIELNHRTLPPSTPREVSRRPSTHEPASEPDESQVPPLEFPPAPPEQVGHLHPIPEDEADGSPPAPAEPPAKMARTNSPEMEATEPTTTSSSSSSAAPAVGTRAPGTPVRRLLDRVPRGTLTPAELLPAAERVARQIQEVESVLEVDRLRERFGRLQEGQEDQDLFAEENWSGTYFNYALGDQSLSLQCDGTWNLMAKRNDEISLKDLAENEKKLFNDSDKVEWSAILNTGAVRVITGKAAEEIRKKFPDRIVSSRMVRRKKPQPELNAWKAKSRWCLHGHRDPDTGTLVTFAPTPQSEGLMLFLQTGANYKMKFAFADVKNAFCQSRPLRRPRGPLYAEPCEGLQLPDGALIEIVIPVYGLDDAPASWRTTVAEYLVQDLGCERNLVEPCWFSKFCPHTGECLAQILVEVDDFIIATRQDNYYQSIKDSMQKRFNFGKWQEDEAEYAGRHIRCTEDAIFIDQYKYIHEQIHPIVLPRGRRQQTDQQLSAEEFGALRSLIYKINWVARESRPEAAGLASILASKLKYAQVQDILTINKFVNFLQTTAERTLKIWQMDPEKMCFVVCSDAGGINVKNTPLEDAEGLPSDATQGAWMVLATEKLPSGHQRVKGSPIAWRSSKLKRKVFSTYGGETQAMLQGVKEVDWLQVMYRDATKHDVQLSNWRNSLSPHMLVMRGRCALGGRQQQCSVTDAKSLYDCLLREHPTGKQDRKSSLELAIVLRDLQETKSMVRWVPHQKLIVDCLTKEDPLRGNDALNQFLKTGILSLVDVDTELVARKSDPSFRRRSHAASRARRTMYSCLGLWSI